MPKLVKSLTDAAVKNAKAKEKDYSLCDGGGLYLAVTKLGRKHWKFKFTQTESKKSNWLSFGAYPEVTLAEAREKRLEARKLLAKGIDPAKERDTSRQLLANDAAHTFEVVAREWHANRLTQWQPNTAKNILHRLEQDVFPLIGATPISSIKSALMLSVTQNTENRGALEVAKRNAGVCSQIFKYAIVKGLVEYDPVAPIRAQLKPQDKSHHAAITVAELSAFLKALIKNEGRMYLSNRIGLRLMMMTFVRTSELIETPWAEIDLEKESWVIPWQRMKMGKRKVRPRMQSHHVFLPRQGWELLRELHRHTGRGVFLFPNQRDYQRPVSNVMILAALRRMGYGGIMTGHGFRSLAKGALKTLGYPVGDIELQLSHSSGEAYGGAYDREEFLGQRKIMMQGYADFLDSVAGGNVVVGNFGKAA